ncbi:MAG: hypothetical protein H6709_11825 [Kofleriaceae bacterium]|nr:hypothetical protein [Kofleriaceae bacterium]MCB9572765.1 hypothetical protein [Kofleriaceae bacterium]
MRAFEAGVVPAAGFHHRDHLHVAWCYLRAMPLEDALARYVRHLRALTVALGVPGKYHATITWAYVILLDDAMHDPALAGADLDAVLAARPALLARPPVAFAGRYAVDELDDPVARARFVLPRPRP